MPAALAAADALPLAQDIHGVWKVAGTRVTLDTILARHRQGDTPEAIAESYPTVPLADVYQVIAHYLKHRAELDEYLCAREALAAEVRHRNEAKFSPAGVRERLLARQRVAKS